ncbi:MAG TPA: T9SS type A sorting domain-containing protein, partial [Saprospiraceae bacterium]|nr:T9SS type A sorting domain-containing protein [Saprospiraceae bacterium]
VGGTADASGNSVFMLVCRFNATGLITASSMGAARPGTGYLYDILQTNDGQLVVAGVLHQSSTAPAKAVVGILGEDLDVREWQEANFPAACRTRDLTQDSDGNFIICGNTYPDDGQPDIFIAKIPATTGTLGAKNFANEPYLLFPNPFRDFTYLKIGESFQSKILTLSALNGKEVRKTIFETSELFIYREGLPSGNYVFAVRDIGGKLLASGKLAVE